MLGTNSYAYARIHKSFAAFGPKTLLPLTGCHVPPGRIDHQGRHTMLGRAIIRRLLREPPLEDLREQYVCHLGTAVLGVVTMLKATFPIRNSQITNRSRPIQVSPTTPRIIGSVARKNKVGTGACGRHMILAAG